MDRQIRILLIEDDEDDYVIFKQYLKDITNWKFELDWASHSEAALKKIRQQVYDICFIDFQLDELNGIETMQKLDQAGFKAPQVILTGKGTHEIDIHAMDAGAADFLEKYSLNAVTLERAIRYVTERWKAIEELRKSEHRLQMLSAKLIDALENERKLIARELHDSIGSSLTAIKFALESKLFQTKSKNAADEVESLEKLISLVHNTINESQRISNNLRPAILDDIGLIKTISWMCRTFQELFDNIRIEKNILAEEKNIPEPLKIVIYRILQESLNNVKKHSQANRVQIQLRQRHETLELQIKDNGLGFDIQKAGESRDGMGIESMKDRAKLSNGTFEISSGKGTGTTIQVAWAI